MAGPAPKGAFSRDNRLPPRDTIVGLETGSEAKAYPMSTLRRNTSWRIFDLALRKESSLPFTSSRQHFRQLTTIRGAKCQSSPPLLWPKASLLLAGALWIEPVFGYFSGYFKRKKGIKGLKSDSLLGSASHQIQYVRSCSLPKLLIPKP